MANPVRNFSVDTIDAVLFVVTLVGGVTLSMVLGLSADILGNLWVFALWPGAMLLRRWLVGTPKPVQRDNPPARLMMFLGGMFGTLLTLPGAFMVVTWYIEGASDTVFFLCSLSMFVVGFALMTISVRIDRWRRKPKEP